MGRKDRRKPEEETGIQKIISHIPQLQKPSSWQAFITGGIVLLLGDHMGAWDIDGWFTTGQMTTTDLVAIIAALGSISTMMARGRRGK